LYSLSCCRWLLVCDSGDVHSYFLVVVVENKCVEEFVEEANQHEDKTNLTQEMRRVVFVVVVLVVVVIACSFDRWESVGIALLMNESKQRESEVNIKNSKSLSHWLLASWRASPMWNRMRIRVLADTIGESYNRNLRSQMRAVQWFQATNLSVFVCFKEKVYVG